MSRLKWDRPRYRIEGKQTEDVAGYGEVRGKKRRRQRKRVKATMLSDGTVVPRVLSQEEVAEMEAEIAARGGKS